MRWGVRDEATDDHMTTELCMKEIENCQRLSMGPNFVVKLNTVDTYTQIKTKKFTLLPEPCVHNFRTKESHVDILLSLIVLCSTYRYFLDKNMVIVRYLHTLFHQNWNY